jgi:hypothetical protein
MTTLSISHHLFVAALNGDGHQNRSESAERSPSNGVPARSADERWACLAAPEWMDFPFGRAAQAVGRFND